MKISAIAKRMMIINGILVVPLIAGALIYYRSMSFLPFALGSVLGVGASIIRIIMLDHSVQKVVTMDKDRAGAYMTLQQILRFLIAALALIAAVFLPFMNLYGTAGGILTFQIAAMLVKKSEKKAPVDDNSDEEDFQTENIQ